MLVRVPAAVDFVTLFSVNEWQHRRKCRCSYILYRRRIINTFSSVSRQCPSQKAGLKSLLFKKPKKKQQQQSTKEQVKQHVCKVLGNFIQKSLERPIKKCIVSVNEH